MLAVDHLNAWKSHWFIEWLFRLFKIPTIPMDKHRLSFDTISVKKILRFLSRRPYYTHIYIYSRRHANGRDEPCSIALSSSHFLRVVPWDVSLDWPHSSPRKGIFCNLRGTLSSSSIVTSNVKSRKRRERNVFRESPGTASVLDMYRIYLKDNDPKGNLLSGNLGKSQS